MNRLETLMHQWEDGSILAGELIELKELLQKSENREALVKHLQVSNTISNVIEEQNSDTELSLASLEQKPPIPFPGERISSRRIRSSRRHRSRRPTRSATPMTWILAAAAVFAIVVGAQFMGGPSAVQIDQASQVSQVRGSVFVVNQEGRMPLRTGMWVEPGDRVVSEEGGHLQLTFADQTQLSIGSNSRCSALKNRSRAKHFEVEQGTLIANVTAQSSQSPMRILAGITETTVLGTQFKVEKGVGQTRVELYRGRVKVAIPSTGQSVELTPNHYTFEEKGRLADPLALGGAKDPDPVPQQRSVQSLTLINPATNMPLAGYDPLDTGKPISRTRTGLQAFNLRINPEPGILSFRIKAYFQAKGDGQETSIREEIRESQRPYSIFGDSLVAPVGYHAQAALVGRYRIVIQSYSDKGGTTPSGPPETFSIQVTK